jgi:hypothetical protein
MNLAREAFAFFSHAAKNTDAEIARIANEWLQETASDFPWLKLPIGDDAQRTLRLVHTYDGAIWDRLVGHLDGSKPRHFFVAAPFHDANGEMTRRIATQWPQSQLELLVQPGYTTLAVKPLKKMAKVRLSELRNSSRRLHAKILAWRTQSGSGCLVGSANFTTAAFDGRNVETCLLVSQADKLIDALFDRNLSKQPLDFDEFVPGDAESQEDESGLPPLRIDSAVLVAEDRLRITYTCQLEPRPDSLRLAIYAAGEVHPRATLSIQNKVEGKQTVPLPDEVFAEAHGVLLASLSADVKGERLESRPLWIIQESRLTYEPGEGSSSSKDRIEVSGQGLAEFLDELGKQKNGLRMVVEYLHSLNIRFYDGSLGGLRRRGFNLKIHDPFHTDSVPNWLIEAGTESENLELAIDAFVERHERRRLLKHAGRGNINGMENFLDILRAMVRLLYVYYRRRVVKKSALIARLRTFIELATIGRRALGEHSEKDSFDGYLCSVSENLSGDRELLQKVCDETNYVADVVALLLIAQSVRFDPKEQIKDGPPPLRPREVLPYYAQAIQTAIGQCRLKKAGPAEVRRALEGYRMFSEAEIEKLIAEL